MSFFDEDDEPTRTRTRPRRAAPPPGRGRTADPSAIRTRQIVAVVGALVFLLLLGLAFKGCADSRKKNALKDYNREHTSLVSESDRQVGAPFFEQLNQVGDASANDIAANVGALKVTANTQLDQAERLDVPDEMVGAQRSLLITLEMRRDALEFIQGRIASALADDQEVAQRAVDEIAGQMQAFLAADVIHESRVMPMIKAALDDADIGGQRIQRSRFVQSLAWMDPAFIADRLDAQVGSGGSTRSGEVRPGLHGHGVTSTRAGETTLTAGGGTVNRLPSQRGLPFVVTFENQGENDEFDVKVVLRIEPDGGKAIRVERTIDKTAAGARAEASLTVPTPPAAGTAATVTVEVRPVPGEKKTDNNKATYNVLFTQG